MSKLYSGENDDGELTGIDRTKRVKEARDEAKKEIDAYKKAKDEEFKKFEFEVRWLGPPKRPILLEYGCYTVRIGADDIVLAHKWKQEGRRRRQ